MGDKYALIELFTPLVLVSIIAMMGVFINATRLGAAAVDHFDAVMIRTDRPNTETIPSVARQKCTRNATCRTTASRLTHGTA